MKQHLNPLLALLVLALTPSWAFYSSSDNVVELTPKNFKQLVLDDDATWVVEFYAPWCGHCKGMVPEFKKLACEKKDIINVGAINADLYKELKRNYGVHSFPTILIFKDKKKPITYEGGRTAAEIASAALSRRPHTNSRTKTYVIRKFQ